jgi:hypothetical protein
MLSYRIDSNTGIVEILGQPLPSPQEVKALAAAVAADAAYRPGFGFLRDRRGMEPFPIDAVPRTADLLTALPVTRGSRLAFVTGAAPASYGTMRMLQELIAARGAAVTVGVFAEEVAARRWLAETAGDRRISAGSPDRDPLCD